MHPRISRVMWCGGGCSQDDAVMRSGGCRELCSAHWPTALGETKNCTSANNRSLHFVDTLIFPPLSLSLVGDWASCPQCIRCKLWPEARPSLSQNKRSQLQGENQTIFPINGNFLAKNSACRSCWCLVVTHYSGWFLSALRYAGLLLSGCRARVDLSFSSRSRRKCANWCWLVPATRAPQFNIGTLRKPLLLIMIVFVESWLRNSHMQTCLNP